VTAVAVWYVGPRSQEARALPAPLTVDVGLRSEAMASLSVRSPVGTSLELHLKLAWTLFFTHPDPVMGESFEAMSL
jgi:hypothetical protein